MEDKTLFSIIDNQREESGEKNDEEGTVCDCW
jgi:hypothetical protein